MRCNDIPLPGGVPGGVPDEATPESSVSAAVAATSASATTSVIDATTCRKPSVVLAIDTKEAPPADAPTVPRTTASRVASFLAERDSARDLVYDAMLARAGYIMVAGIIPCALATALYMFEFIDSEMYQYTYALGYTLAGCGVVCMTTLPPDSFDFDNAMDNRPLARRAMTISLMLLSSTHALRFPHAVSGVGAFAFFVKLIWDERAVGCCQNVRSRDHHRHDHRRDHHRDHHRARRHSGYRPRMSDVACICFTGFVTLQYSLHSILQLGPCHAAAATTFNASTPTSNMSVDTATNSTACADNTLTR